MFDVYSCNALSARFFDVDRALNSYFMIMIMIRVSDSHKLSVHISAPKIFHIYRSLCQTYCTNQVNLSCITARLLMCNVIAVTKCIAAAWNLDSLSQPMYEINRARY